MTVVGSGSGHWRLDWPTSAGTRIAKAALKSCPEDFMVDEVPGLDGFPESPGLDDHAGEGEHLCLRLQKSGDNTEYVARELAALSGCRHFDVGFCGLKDRHAVTRQWFSIYRPGQETEDKAFIDLVGERWPVLSACRYRRKLRRGEHQGNRFVITLRHIAGAQADLETALVALRERGAPNYFGPQRFGIAGANLDRAVEMGPDAMDRKRHGGGRGGRGGKRGGGRSSNKNAIYFSAARSWIFNEVLARRVESDCWTEPLEGEPGLPENTRMPTGPLWGDGGTSATGPQELLEREVAAQAPELLQLFSTTRMQPERRALVLRPEQLVWSWPGEDCLRLEFFLPPGQYATTVLSDIFELEDLSLGQYNNQQG